ncbi:MAG TPA: hypothetical protein VMD05_03650, partial [Candidatus Nanoarchaeia archaeon]|nr:hypothetical protein [Candidatus Nanoarchaeia archaeon]
TTSGGEGGTVFKSTSQLTYTDSSLTNGQTYYYQVTAVNAAGESPKSTETSAKPSTPNNLVAKVGTDKSTYSRGSTATITTTVTDGTNPVQGATVTVSIKGPRGTVVWTGSGTTNANGVLTLSYRTSSSFSTRGSYTVTSTASKTGYQTGTATTSFSVS